MTEGREMDANLMSASSEWTRFHQRKQLAICCFLAKSFLNVKFRRRIGAPSVDCLF